jgi:DNA-binding PadR family transcriptional regulator
VLGPKRRYYRITEAGLRTFEAQSAEWGEFARSVERLTRALSYV